MGKAALKKKSRKPETETLNVKEFLKAQDISIDKELEEMMEEGGAGIEIGGRIGALNQSSKKGKKKEARRAAQAVEPEEAESDDGDLNSEEERELELYLEMMEQEKGEPSDDDEEQGDDELVERIYANQTTALLSRKADIAVGELPWIEQMTVTSTAATADAVPDVNDDLKRELAFYEQALYAATEGRRLVKAAGVPFSRPSDYFAEMVKSDDHMQKVRQKLLDEEKGILESEKAKKQRDLKKFGKQVQVEKLLERQKQKKDALDKVKGLRRKGLGDKLEESLDFDVEVGCGR
ncbi:rRNA-processing protein and EBNA1-binding protein ebp2 [Kappamyces sp. JEL0829]|nr:rRNA-processing protein and EBNA1-binding protein ebp2 [Kappamyces sp. JEL0829]